MLAGGLAGTLAAAVDLVVVTHFAITGGIGLVAGLAATYWLVGERRQPGQPLLARPSGRLLLLGVVAFCVFMLDGTANNWSAAQLRGDRAASPGLAAAGFTAFTLALTFGRLAGDRLIARFDRIRVVQASGLIAAAGGAIVVVAPSAALTLVGWAVLGAGVAAVAPAVLGAAPSLTEAPAPVAIAAVTTLGYLGSFTGPPLVGGLAELLGLSRALGLLVVGGAVMALLARRALRPRVTAPARCRAAARW
jgi:MFS family permease